MSDISISNQSEDNFSDLDEPLHYLDKFVKEIQELPHYQKMGQIGIEPSVLGIPKENLSYLKARSFFSNEPFEPPESLKIPKEWIDISYVNPPSTIIEKMPDLTLFFIFYMQPHDESQISSADTLIKRGWIYNEKEMKWYKQLDEGFQWFDIHKWCIRSG